jgi:hypothetical protein
MAFAPGCILAGDIVVVERGHLPTAGGIALLAIDGDRGSRALREDDTEVTVLGVASRVVRLLLPPFGP